MLTFDYLLTAISQEEVFMEYLNTDNLNQKFLSPFREKDKTPGCFFKYTESRTLYFYDFAHTIRKMNCGEFVANLCNITFREALFKINKDLGLNLLPFENNERKVLKTIVKREQTIQKTLKKKYKFQFQDFTEYDLKYWSQFGFTVEDLKHFKIRSVKRVSENDILWATSYEKNPIFVYCDSKGPFKIYQPKANKFKKWRSIRQILEGYELLDKTKELCFITKSYKDVMLLYKLGYTSFAPPSENTIYELYDIIFELRTFFKWIYVFFDNDEPGKKSSLKITKELNLNYINCPNDEPKDPTDYVKKYDLKKLNQLIKNKFKRDKMNDNNRDK